MDNFRFAHNLDTHLAWCRRTVSLRGQSPNKRRHLDALAGRLGRGATVATLTALALKYTEANLPADCVCCSNQLADFRNKRLLNACDS